jgi:hypothetical protein
MVDGTQAFIECAARPEHDQVKESKIVLNDQVPPPTQRRSSIVKRRKGDEATRRGKYES